MIEFVALGFETGFDVSKTFSISQLSKSHASILILTGETFYVSVSIVALNAPTKGVLGQKIHGL